MVSQLVGLQLNRLPQLVEAVDVLSDQVDLLAKFNDLKLLLAFRPIRSCQLLLHLLDLQADLLQLLKVRRDAE